MLHTRRTIAMGGRANIVLETHRSALVDEIEQELGRLERLWSRFVPDSELSRLNAAGGRPTRVDPATVELIEAMRSGHAETDGCYDPTLLPRQIEIGDDRSVLDPSRVSSAPTGSRPVADLDGIRIDGDRVALPPGMALDAGGIGKGLAADLLVRRALEDGATGAMVEIGGDLVVAGAGPDDGGWTIGIEQPDDPGQHVDVIRLGAGAVATSGTSRRTWRRDGIAMHHLLDPSTLLPARTGLATATVVAGSGARAEALAKRAFMRPSREVLAWWPQRNAAGLLITLDGTLLETDNWAELR